MAELSRGRLEEINIRVDPAQALAAAGMIDRMVTDTDERVLFKAMLGIGPQPVRRRVPRRDANVADRPYSIRFVVPGRRGDGRPDHRTSYFLRPERAVRALHRILSQRGPAGELVIVKLVTGPHDWWSPVLVEHHRHPVPFEITTPGRAFAMPAEQGAHHG